MKRFNAAGQMQLGGHDIQTLEDAMAYGQGEEIDIRCPHPTHLDTKASASYNPRKQMWFCHACHESGKADSKTAPKIEDLLAWLEPEKATRTYADSWLAWFTAGAGEYWRGRFEPYLVDLLRFGDDPLTGDNTFPVHTAGGRLAGVGRRLPGADRRYMYPPSWSASKSLHGYQEAIRLGRPTDIVVLVEGAADAAAIFETGCVGLGTYGAGVHLPQVELVNRLQPRLIIAGSDSDTAGDAAAERAIVMCEGHELVRVKWSDGGAKDPADLTVDVRRSLLAEAVASSTYGSDPTPRWIDIAATEERRYEARSA